MLSVPRVVSKMYQQNLTALHTSQVCTLVFFQLSFHCQVYHFVSYAVLCSAFCFNLLVVLLKDIQFIMHFYFSSNWMHMQLENNLIMTPHNNCLPQQIFFPTSLCLSSPCLWCSVNKIWQTTNHKKYAHVHVLSYL